MAKYRKPQQQTLSIRICDETRNRLERARELVGGKQGSVSTSEVAKLYLESMPDAAAALEAAHLLTKPTQSLLMIRRKWQYWEHLSRAEWDVIGYYVQHGAEDQSKDPVLPRCDTIADLLQAFLALRNLRTDARPDLDAYYTSKLLDSELRVPSQGPGDTLAHTVRQVIDELRTGSSTARPAFAGRIFRLAIRDEPLTSIQAASQALAPFWAALSRQGTC